MLISGLYGMVDPNFGDPNAQIALLVDEGVSPIQLRCKGWSREAVRALAQSWRAHSTLVINDDAALAAELGLYVHLGQDDGAPTGPHGRSTHDLQQIRAAQHGSTPPPLYLGFGPIFSTQTKTEAGPGRGLTKLAQAVQVATVPVVAIGGINQSNLDNIRATGVAGWAVLAGIWRSPNPKTALRQLRN